MGKKLSAWELFKAGLRMAKKNLGSAVTFQWSLGHTRKNTECTEPLNP